MKVHPDPAPSKGHAFHAQPQTLFLAVLTCQSNPASCGHHTVPGQPSSTVERSDGETRGAREPNNRGHLAVRDHLPSWDPRDHPS